MIPLELEHRINLELAPVKGLHKCIDVKIASSHNCCDFNLELERDAARQPLSLMLQLPCQF